MPFRKAHVRRVLADAVSDREEFLQAVAGDARQEEVTRKDLRRLRGLQDRYDSGTRVRLEPADLATLRLACHCALIWREGFLDSIRGMRDAELTRRTREQIKVAKAVMVEAGGSVEDPFAGGRSVSLEELKSAKVFPGTEVRVVRNGDVEVRSILEHGEPLGRIETDGTGVVKVTLPDGKIINEPFETAFDAQQWLLARFSKNLLFSGGRAA